MERKLLLLMLVFPFTVFGQFTDDFSDGDFTHNPTWTGHTDKFVVEDQMLRLSDSEAGQAWLATPSSIIDHTQWEFWIRLAFTPSDNNYPRIYLTSDSEDLLAPLNGYYLRIGKTGTDNKRIYLYRQTGSTHTELLSGAANIATTTNNRIRIKVTRDDTGYWEVWADPQGGNFFMPQGSIADDTHTHTQWFGVLCTYTVTNSNRFYFDDFYVGEIIQDTTPPQVTQILATGPQSLEVHFSKAIEPLSAQSTGNYFVNKGIGAPASAVRPEETPDRVLLEFVNSFDQGETYTLTVSNIQDFFGNMLMAFTGDFAWYVPGRFDVVFNEIMANPTPAVGLPPHEYVEFYNTTDYPINMEGWTFQHGNTQRTIPFAVIQPRGYMVITHPAALEAFSDFEPVVAIPGLSSSALTNSGTTLILYDEAMEMISFVIYTDQWYRDPEKSSGGWAMEAIDPYNYCGGAGNWQASEDPRGGSPAEQNSVWGENPDLDPPRLISVRVEDASKIILNFNEPMHEYGLTEAQHYFIDNDIGFPASVVAQGPDFSHVELHLAAPLLPDLIYKITLSGLITDCAGNSLTESTAVFADYQVQRFDVVFSEIMANPTPQVGLPPYRYVEVYNTSAFPINLTGWTLDYSVGQRTLPPVSIVPGGYAVLTTREGALAMAEYDHVFAVPDLPATFLTIGGRTLTLSCNSGELISFVSYSEQWYQDAAKAEGGWSLEIIDPYNFCGGHSNWRASEDPRGGTPGAENSVMASNPDVTSPRLLSVVIENPIEITLYFDEPMDEAGLLNTENFTLLHDHPISSSPREPDFSVTRLILPAALEQDVVYEIFLGDEVTDCAGNNLLNNHMSFADYTPRRYDIVFNEIMANPTPSIGLPSHKYLELYNTSQFPVSLYNWVMTYGAGQRTLPAVTIPSGGYAVLTTTAGARAYEGYPSVFGVEDLPATTFLTAAGQTLTLQSPQGELISFVSYSDQWYRDASRSGGGWSLEKIDLHNFCEGAGNWKASNDPRGGTPGEPNSVMAENPDITAPYLWRAGFESLNQISLFFSEPMEEKTLLPTHRYRFSHNMGAPLHVEAVPPDFRKVILTLPDDMQQGEVYTVTLTGSVTDCAGNVLDGNTARFGVPEYVDSLDLVINEILFNPPDRGVRYVEIYNRSQKILELKDHVLSSRDTIEHVLSGVRDISLESQLIFPGDYRVITPAPAVVKQQYMTPNPLGFIEAALPSMTNTHGIVVLATRGQRIIDMFTYTEDLHYPLLTDKKGVALERVNYHRPTQDASNWHSAAQTVGFGTPGYKNSQFTWDPDKVADVFEVYPEIFSPNSDGVDDLLHIAWELEEPGYTANVSIYDSRGRLVRTLVRSMLLATRGVITWDGATDQNQKADMGIYIVYIELFDPQGKVKTFRKTAVLAGRL